MKKAYILIALVILHINTFAGDTPNVTLTNFKGVYTDQKQVELEWFTMMEANVDHYEIQRSGDGVNFRVVDTMASKMKINTNSYELQYDYTDANPLTGISYYRIRVVGRDGSSNQSPVVEINNDISSGVRMYPTVIRNNMIFVESDKNLRSAKLEFYDLSGHKISETNWASLNGRENTQISKSGSLKNGTYLARLTANGQSVKNQLVIVTTF